MSDYLLLRRSQKLGLTAPKSKEVKPIAKRSEKRKVEQKEYIKIVKEMAAISDKCEIKEANCDIIMTGLHHKKKRSPATFLDKRFLLRACNSCQLWIELHPLESIDKGYSISKHKKSAA